MAAGFAELLLGLATALAAAEAPAGVDPEALAILRRATDAVGSLERFSLRAESTLEAVLVSGQKIEFDSDVTLTVERPNRMAAARRGAASNQSLFFDGADLVLYSPKEGYYAAAKPPATLEGMLDFARDELDLTAPAADLIYRDAYESLIEGMTSGFVVGRDARLGGESCTHLAFRKPGVDVQIWVSNGDRPLPMKYVLTTTDQAANPRFGVTIAEWNLDPQIDSSTFRFEPPPGARRIEFLRANSTPATTH
jgi:hypothetical protein